MLNGLDWMMQISLVVVIGCAFIIICKFVKYFNNKKKILACQKKDMQEIRILETKLAEMKLKNKGYSLDENIKLISNEEDLSFSMEWRKILE